MNEESTRSADRRPAGEDTVAHGDPEHIIGQFAARDIIASTMRPDRVVAVKRYDFRRPDKFSREELRTLSIVHETLARANSATLSALCRHGCTLRIRAVDQLNFGEYQALLPQAGIVGTASLSPLPGSFVFSMDGGVSEAIIELLGGAGSPTPTAAPTETPTEAPTAPMGRGITELERAALGSVWSRLVEDLREAWAPIVEAEGRFEGLQPLGSRDIRIVNDCEMIVLVAFDCAIGAASGEITFALPFLFLEPIIPKLTARWYYAPRKGTATRPRSAAALIPLPSTLYYEAGELSLARLHALKRGDLLPLAESRDGSLLLEVGGRPLLRLVRAKRGKAGPYAVTSTSVRGSSLADMSEEIPCGTEGRGTGDADIRAAFAEMAAGLERSLDQVGRKLEEVSARQDELADRAFFGEGGAERGEGEGERPLSVAEGLDRRRLAAFLADEHPQTAALVLSALESAVAGDLLSLLPSGLQGEVARRIERIGSPSALLLAELEATFRRRSDLARGERAGALGGAGHLAEMRRSASASTAATIAEILGDRG